MLLVLLAQAAVTWFSFSHAVLSTMCTLLLAAGGLSTLFEICRPLCLRRIGLCIAMLLGLGASIVLLGPQFDLVWLTILQAIIVSRTYGAFLSACAAYWNGVFPLVHMYCTALAAF